MNKTFIYLPKKILEEANDASIREGRNQNLEPKWIKALDDNFNAIVMFEHYQTRDEIRLVLMLSPGGPPVFLDVSRIRFQSLPRATVDEDGNYTYESEVELQKRRPYPNGREWQESVVKKPVRKQASFRKQVLEAYGNKCALCSIEEASLLRAAHIMDVVNGGPDCVSNGICLCVNHEIAFDRGLILIEPDYSVIHSSSISETALFFRAPSDLENQPNAQYLKLKLSKLK